MNKQIIIRNSISCRKCGDDLVSEHRHDFRWCECGAVAVDGGRAYLKRVGDLDDWIETSIVEGGDTYDPSAIGHLRGMRPRTDRTPEQRRWADDFLRGEGGLEMLRRRFARADPAAVLKALDQFGTEPPEPGDEIDE
jgi:hypothetical protein